MIDQDKKMAAEMMKELTNFEGLDEPEHRALSVKKKDESGITAKKISEIPNDVLKFAELSIVEKKELEKFIEDKRYLEVKKYPKESILTYYLQGLESVDIVKIVPNTTVGGIVYLKTQEHWVDLRKEFIKHLETTSDFKLALTKHRSTTILSTILNVWHDRVEKGLADYIRTGNKEYLPVNFTVKNFKDYEKYMKLLKQLDDMSGKSNKIVEPNDKSKISIQADSLTIQNQQPTFDSNKISPEHQKELLQQRSLNFFKQLENAEETPEE